MPFTVLTEEINFVPAYAIERVADPWNNTNAEYQSQMYCQCWQTCLFPPPHPHVARVESIPQEQHIFASEFWPIWSKLNLPCACDSDKCNGNKIFVCSKQLHGRHCHQQ